jgi:hypothetical protein
MFIVTPRVISAFEIDIEIGLLGECPLVHVVTFPSEAEQFCEAERVFAALLSRLPMLVEVIDRNSTVCIELDPSWRHAKDSASFQQMNVIIEELRGIGFDIKLQAQSALQSSAAA